MENYICNIDCIFRAFAGETEMMNFSRFNKIIKDCQLIDSKFTLIDGYMIFSQFVSKMQIKRISFDQFMASLHLIAAKKECMIDDVIIKIGRKGFGGPIFRGTNGFSKLTEPRKIDKSSNHTQNHQHEGHSNRH